MTISNRKPGQQKEAPTEPLKRSVASCLKAIARHPELEVTFAADKPALIPGRARLPEPPRKLSAADVAILRGHADSMALRMACHDAAIHRKLMPEGEGARAVYDAVEQARVESIGARRMEGVGANIGAMLQDKYHRGARYEDITDRADAPIEDAVALMVREKLTGLKPPAAAQPIVDLWREHIEAKAGRDLDALSGAIEDQRAFSRVVRDLLTSLDMADDISQSPDEDDSENEDENEQDQSEQDEGDAEEQSKASRPRWTSARTPPRRWRRGPRKPPTRRPATGARTRSSPTPTRPATRRASATTA